MSVDDELRRARNQEKRLSTASVMSSSSAHNYQGFGRSSGPGMARHASYEGQNNAPRPQIERFCFVRPAPHHLRHPMNLQVQLITSTSGGHLHRSASNVTSASARSSSEFSTTDVSLHAVAQASVGGGKYAYTASTLTTTTAGSADTAGHVNGATAPAAMQATGTDQGPATQQDDDTPIDTSSLNPNGALTSGGLSRSASVRSNRSTTSVASSAGTAGTASSGGSGMRKVMPCYNLEFHSLQPSVVTDAGTDAKVAKIHKRGVEILDFAILDPVFLGQHHTIPTLRQREEVRRAAEAAKAAGAGSSAGTLVAADFKPTNLLNKLKRFSFRSSPTAATSPAEASTPTAPINDVAPSSTKRSSVLSVPSSTPSMSLAKDSTANISGIPVITLFRTKSTAPNNGLGDSQTPTTATVERDSGFLNVPARHAAGYVWIIRQYLRKDLLDVFNASLSGQSAAGADEKEVGIAEVTLEWRKKRRRPTRSKHYSGLGRAQPDSTHTKNPTMHVQKPSEDTAVIASSADNRPAGSSDPPRSSVEFAEGRNRRASQSMSTASSPRVSREYERPLTPNSRTLVGGFGASAAEMLSPNRIFKTRTGGSARSGGERSGVGNGLDEPRPSPERNRSSGDGRAKLSYEPDPDSGEDSDPEDSERPWICELIVKRPQVDSPLQTSQRVLLGTLTPAPHHPKLVAQLSIPLSLPSVNIASVLPGDSQSGPDHSQISFSTEELKDATTVTALWLTVRESLGLGGIHKARKNAGDWRFTTPAALKRD